MTIQWLGHACFKITHKGYSVVIDPYNSDYTAGYPKLKVTADICSSAMSTTATTTARA